MTSLAEPWVIPGLEFLLEWSVRWGVAIAALAAWLALRPPRRAATRYVLCLGVLAAGVLLPAAPRWGDAAVSWPAPTDTTRREPAAAVARVSRTENATLPPSVPDPVRPSPRVEPPQSVESWTVRIDRPTTMAPTPITAWQVAALAVGAGWMAVLLILAVRSVGGAIALVRLRRQAVHADDNTCRLLDECRETLGLSRSVRLAIHPSVASPAVVGGFRPVVLVPPGWTEWPEPDRRACLLHELAHLLRYDDWLKLAQEVLRIPFFFHPAVHWLLGRLDRERELLCDEAAVAMGADPVEYARLLFHLARRPGRLLALGAPTARGCLPFLERRTVKIRIERLLEDDMKGSIRRPSAAGSLLLGGLAIAAALVLGGLRVHAKDDGATTTRPATAPQGQTPGVKKAEAPAPAPIRGVVHDRDGHPVAGATVVLAPYDNDQHGQHALATDAQGRFAWTPPAEWSTVEVLVHKEGLAAFGQTQPMQPPAELRELPFLLDRLVPFSAVLVDAEGRPVAGASVRIGAISTYFEQADTTGMGFIHVRRNLIAGGPLERSFATTTDASGAFTFRVTRPNSGLQLLVTSADGRPLLVRNTTADLAGGRMRREM
ncbi:MAG: M56 family metallopeptidase, partial [Isosphaeraceae bacterium]